MREDWSVIFYGLRQRDLLDRWPSPPPSDLRPKPEEFIPVGEHHRAINRGQTSHGSYRRANCQRLIRRPLAQLGEFAERRRDSIWDGLHDGLPP